MLRVLILLLLSAAPSLADVTGPNGKTVECYCTDSNGDRVEMQQVICLYVDGRAFMARCEMSLNVPMWRPTGEGCASSGLIQRLQPPGDAGAVHAGVG